MAFTPDILTMRIAKQAIAYICKQESIKLQYQKLESAGTPQGRRKHFFGCQAKNIMESNGALARREIVEFNFIHYYDVIIIGHERSSKVTGMLSLPTSA